MLFKYKPDSKDFVEYAKGIRMARMVTAADGRFRMGFAKFSTGIVFERAMWFDEVFYVTKGKIDFTYRSYIPPERGAEKKVEVTAGEAIFMSRGTWMTWQCPEEAELFYCAMPASSGFSASKVDFVIKQKIDKEERHLRTYISGE